VYKQNHNAALDYETWLLYQAQKHYFESHVGTATGI